MKQILSIFCKHEWITNDKHYKALIGTLPCIYIMCKKCEKTRIVSINEYNKINKKSKIEVTE